MDNQILSANINVRTTLEVKKKLMDEADRRDMKMSEYVLFILETHWNKLDAPIEENQELLQLHQELAEMRKKLQETQSKVIELKTENDQLLERLHEEPKTIWQEATETTNKLSEEHIQRQIDIALSGYQQQLREQLIVNENQQIKVLAGRLQLYETPLLKAIFNTLSQGNRNIKDLPDIVAVLTQHYYQEVIVPNQFQPSYYHV
jgi:regulator of replication initiation timing